jgi:hypothetical protein
MEYSAPSQYYYHFLPKLGLRVYREGGKNFVRNDLPDYMTSNPQKTAVFTVTG